MEQASGWWPVDRCEKLRYGGISSARLVTSKSSLLHVIFSDTRSMPDSIQIPEGDAIPTVAANLLPCHIQYTGDANTETYFTPSKTTEINENNEVKDVAHFRGLKLVGVTIKLNDLGYTGYLLNKSESIEKVQTEYSEEFEQEAEIKTVYTHTPVAKFHDLTVYGHDAPVEPSCQWNLIGEWQKLSDVIHEDL